MKEKHKEKKGGSILFYFSAALLPTIPLVFLFNNNKQNFTLQFSHFSFLSMILSAIGVLMFLIFRKITYSSESALAVSFFSWFSFWAFESIITISNWYSNSFYHRMLLLVIFATITTALLLYMRRHYALIRKTRSAFLVFAVTICFLFLYNFAPTLYSEVLLVAFDVAPRHQYEIRTDFVIDNSLPKPDIYWFHMDEMMGFDAVEKYLGDAQNELKAELISRGFVINEDAALHSRTTLFAMPSLLSPSFYDSYLKQLIAEHDHLLRRPFEKEVYNRLQLDGIDLRKDIHSQHELFNAFRAVEYLVAAMSFYNGHFMRSADIVYRDSDADPVAFINSVENREAWRRFGELRELHALIKLVTSSTPLSLFDQMISGYINEQLKGIWLPIPENGEVISKFYVHSRPSYEEMHLYRTLYDSFSIQSPKLVYILNLIAHWPYLDVYQIGEMNHPSPDKPYAFDLSYLSNYEYAAKVMLSAMDMILKENPSAIIILQADHGIHWTLAHDYMLDSGFSEAQVFEIWSSVISAVRIPQHYGGLVEPVNPLNISRMLVNRFVGENYTLISDD